VMAAGEQELRNAREALDDMGVIVDGVHVRVTDEAPESHVALVVCWETPGTYEELERVLASRPVESVALLQPDDVPSFRRLTGNTAVAWNPPARKEAAMHRSNQLRTALRTSLANSAGASASELALLAPLLETHDALEIAAAALRMYEGARRELATIRARPAAAPPQAAGSARSAGPSAGSGAAQGGGSRQRVFLGVGKRDHVRVGDIVGAVANEAGIPGDRIGAVELFESHTTVELSREDAARAVESLASTSLRSRRLNPRIDDRPGGFGGGGGRPRGGARGDRPSFIDRSDRGPRSSSDRPSRPSRPTDRGERGDRGDRGDRSARPARDDQRDARGPRAGGRESTSEARRSYADRPARERAEPRKEWSERGTRMQHAKRTPRPEAPERGAGE
jgi:ATP-dependent RNA helicase DeaD